MQTTIKKLDVLNQLIYDNLEKILKKLNKRMHIKLYALVNDKKQAPTVIRIKKTVANGDKALSTSQDELQSLENVFAELKVDPAQAGDAYEQIKSYLNEEWYKQHDSADASNNAEAATSPSENEDGHAGSTGSQMNDTRLLYINRVPFQFGRNTHSVIYMLEIRNVEQETRQQFFLKPELSFLRMLLDYYFNDFYAYTKNHIKINDDDSITSKYNEDEIQFNRRLARLFFGKMQSYLQSNKKFEEFGSGFDHELRNEYYVNSLLEKVDDISSLSYENASPFGSILFMNKDVITQQSQQSIIRFTVTFTKDDRIGLDDAKRIRKLLELTNVDKDLYLIADENEIYGLGEVNWNLQKGILAFRLDFTGLSKYNLVLVRTEPEFASGGKLFVEDQKKVYRSDLSLIETKLVAISFKNPKLGEEGYSSEKFTALLRNTFLEEYGDYGQAKQKIERLDLIVRKAREQKHGTMVVITNRTTAEEEMASLRKQSTPIEPGLINPEYIKFLTAIDGAIYLDTDGNCHAIGVILDGISKDGVGDASRGARYNSAHRYLHKLKDARQQKKSDEQAECVEQKKCVIVIISEDGMVDLIPESEHEDMLLAMAEEVIDLIQASSPDREKLKEKEDTLLQSKIVDSDWLFKIADVMYANDNEERAIEFYKYGIERAEKSYVNPRHYNYFGNCYYTIGKYQDAIDVYLEAIEDSFDYEDHHIYQRNIGYSYLSLALQLKEEAEAFENELHDAIEWLNYSIEREKTRSKKPSARVYSSRGRCYLELSDIEKKTEGKVQLLKNSYDDYSQAITLNSHNKTYYWNRYCANNRLRKLKGTQINIEKECIEDLIHAEHIQHDDAYINALSPLLKKRLDLVAEAAEFYRNLIGDKEGSPELQELLAKHSAQAETSKQAEAAAGKAPDADDSKA
ncbi:hypothetical protein PaecuDRAFT_2928 [Paenibacillus curdlanolyticus YK9]|uniref:DAC domain-containing protein n=1 Tax=Paenibacillus curdlanolyticus YK9 TaxID=717606 RepID=E0IAT8_9BACL|nr:diadenylate cyclase [Paenibacillus curdlanolyticus]EFM10492.1 hypothetical protein PaecuDRAFT_2928 [Paenibacillus curdlanolyticus YK9]